FRPSVSMLRYRCYWHPMACAFRANTQRMRHPCPPPFCLTAPAAPKPAKRPLSSTSTLLTCLPTRSRCGPLSTPPLSRSSPIGRPALQKTAGGLRVGSLTSVRHRWCTVWLDTLMPSCIRVLISASVRQHTRQPCTRGSQCTFRLRAPFPCALAIHWLCI
ncbi:hypothetical protein EV177_010822, partial [Coemansia sp. RSA 1804]